MKHLFKFMLVLLLIAGCNKPADLNKSNKLIPDISDLSITEELQEIYAGRRKNLMEQIEDGTVILRSDCAFDGGRHEWRAAMKSLLYMKKGKLLISRRYNRLPLLPSGPGGVQQELAV